jgi:hypothetical protein
MAIANGSFETAGTTPGSASGWAASFVSSAEELADFARNPSEVGTLAHENFDAGWAGLVDQVFESELGLETVGIETSAFNLGPAQLPFEPFEFNWGAPTHLPTLSAIEFAAFSGADRETFDVGWGNVDLTLPAPTAATFSGNPEERFETGWSSIAFTNELDDFTPAQASDETFESVLAPIAFTADAATSVMTLASAPSIALADNQVVLVANADGFLPNPLNEGVAYFLRNVSGLAFKLAPFSGGTPLDLTDAGEGVQSLLRDPVTWWSRVMTTV